MPNPMRQFNVIAAQFQLVRSLIQAASDLSVKAIVTQANMDAKAACVVFQVVGMLGNASNDENGDTALDVLSDCESMLEGFPNEEEFIALLEPVRVAAHKLGRIIAS